MWLFLCRKNKKEIKRSTAHSVQVGQCDTNTLKIMVFIRGEHRLKKLLARLIRQVRLLVLSEYACRKENHIFDQVSLTPPR